MENHLFNLSSLLGRLFIGTIFLMSAIGNKIPQFSSVVSYMETKGVPLPSVMLVGAIVFLVVGSLSVITGFKTRLGAALLLMFLILATYFFHNFWDLEGEVRQAELIQFMKNLSMAGAMLFLIGNGGGNWSLDGCRKSKLMNRATMDFTVKTLASAFVLCLSPLCVGAQVVEKPATISRVENWVQWRGPTADGRAGDRAEPPTQWGKSTNIAWAVDLLGEGSATPIVFGNQVIVLSAFKTDRKSPKPVENDERAKTTPDEFFYQFVVSSYDRSSGNILWQQVVVEEVPHEGKHNTNTYAAGSPVTDGERLYFSFGSRGVFCYSLDGKPIWKLDLGNMRTRRGWGEAVTPALTDDLVVINWDQEEDSFIAAIDKQTGQIRWKKDRSGEVTSWNTPFVTKFEGTQQIIVNGTGSVKSYDAKDGSVLWECGGQTVNAIPSPIRFNDSVICMSGYRGSLACSIPLHARGNVTESNRIDWKISQGTPYVPSPIFSGTRLLFTKGNTNVLSCLDANTGQPLLERMRLEAIRSMYASPILAGGHFYFTSRDGTTVVIKDNESLEIVAVNDLDDVIDASPVAVDDQLFLRSWNKLYCIQDAPVSNPNATSQKSKPQPTTPLPFKQVNHENTSETSANASVGDLDGDGTLDIVLAKGHWPIHNRILLNDGKGNFKARNLGRQPDRAATLLFQSLFSASSDRWAIITSRFPPGGPRRFSNEKPASRNRRWISDLTQ